MLSVAVVVGAAASSIDFMLHVQNADAFVHVVLLPVGTRHDFLTSSSSSSSSEVVGVCFWAVVFILFFLEQNFFYGECQVYVINFIIHRFT